MRDCPTCGGILRVGGRFCSWCGNALPEGVVVTEAEPHREPRSTIPASLLGFLVVATGVAAIVVPHAPAPPARPSAHVAEIRPDAPSPERAYRRFERHTLESMATSGARSLALNMAAGNTEVVQALLGGPISLAASSHCSVEVVSSLLYPAPHGRETRAQHQVDVELGTSELHPRAIGSASARVPEGVPPPRGEVGGERRPAHGVRVTTLLYDCGTSSS